MQMVENNISLSGVLKNIPLRIQEYIQNIVVECDRLINSLG